MKIIIDTDLASVSGAAVVDNVTSCVASSEDASFLDENLRDDFTTNLWKAASGTTATITLQVSKGCAVMLMNTNATEAVVTAGSGETYTLETDYTLETGYSLAADEVAVIEVYKLPGSAGRLWAGYSEFTGPHIVTISLTAATPVSAGIVRAGNVEEFKDPAPSLGESSIDFSIEKEMNNGADYFRKRNVVRTYDALQMIETRPNAWTFKHDIFDAVGPKPLAIRLVQNANITDDEFVIFARRLDPPHLEHLSNAHSRVTFSLRAVI